MSCAGESESGGVSERVTGARGVFCGVEGECCGGDTGVLCVTCASNAVDVLLLVVWCVEVLLLPLSPSYDMWSGLMMGVMDGGEWPQAGRSSAGEDRGAGGPASRRRAVAVQKFRGMSRRSDLVPSCFALCSHPLTLCTSVHSAQPLKTHLADQDLPQLRIEKQGSHAGWGSKQPHEGACLLTLETLADLAS